MPLQTDWYNKLVLVTFPTTQVTAQELHDFIEDEMAAPVGLLSDGTAPFHGDIIVPEGKVVDENNPGVYSQIILKLNLEWQIQFWQGSGYTRIYGGKIVGGVNGQPLKATGAAGDISVLESPVDGVTTVVMGSNPWDTEVPANPAPGSFGELVKSVGISIDFLKEMEGGRWEIDGNQMIFYGEDNITEVARFNLFDSDGSPTSDNPTERVRV